MTEYRCPENIVRLFDNPKTIGEGRAKALEWASNVGATYGDTLLMPDSETGALIPWYVDRKS